MPFDIEQMDVRSAWILLRKAKENFLCAKGARDKGWINAAASRLYYALFLAGKEYAEARGRKAKALNGRWEHWELARAVGRLSRRSNRQLLLNCASLRRMADYDRVLLKPKQVDTEQAKAKAFLDFVLKEMHREAVSKTNS